MLERTLLFAAKATDTLPPALQGKEASKLFGLSMRDLMLLAGIGLIIGLVLFLWAYLTRRERRRHISRISPAIGGAERHVRASEPDERGRVRKRRRRHPDNLPRNPTLGETGGLPPIRPDEPAQPA
jgi:hypothetical protein